MSDEYDLMRGAGDVGLWQEWGDSRPNVAHFYGPDAMKEAREWLQSPPWQPTHYRIGREPGDHPIREFPMREEQ